MGIPLRVLIIENSASHARHILAELTNGGYDCAYRRVDSPEAMSVALREKVWDIVVGNHALRRHDGPTAIKALGDTGLDIPIIAISDDDTEEAAVLAMRSGACDHLTRGRLARLALVVSRELKAASHGLDEALRESEQRFRNFFANQVAATAITSPTKGWVEVNDKLCEMLGYSREELSQMTWSELTYPDDLAPDVAQFDRLVAGEIEGYVLDKRFVRKDGTVVPVILSVACIRNEDRTMKYITAMLLDITERKRAEDALQAAKEYAENLIETANAIFVRLDTSGNVVQMNRSAEKATGYRLDEVRGRSWFEVIVPKDRYPEVWAVFEKLAGSGIVKNFENPILTKSGEERHILWQNSEVREDGAIAGTLSFGLDITERKTAEEALRHSHELMRYIIEHNRSAVAVHDKDMNYIYISQRYLDDYNVKARDIIGKNHYDVFPNLPQKWRDAHKKALAGEITSAEDDPYVREDGSVDWTRWECRPWYEADGSIGGVIVYTEIITERKLAEQEKRRFYRDTIRSVTQGKLDLVTFDEVKDYIGHAELTAAVISLADTAAARHTIREYCKTKGLAVDRLALFESAVGEAATNAVKHGGKGRIYAGTRGNAVWVAVSDKGPGISTITLPNATLRRGFSTKASMGVGFTIMMEASDEVKLCTGTKGTTVLLVINIDAQDNAASLTDLPDTWNDIDATS